MAKVNRKSKQTLIREYNIAAHIFNIIQACSKSHSNIIHKGTSDVSKGLQTLMRVV